jgi:hypothetical protein
MSLGACQQPAAPPVYSAEDLALTVPEGIGQPVMTDGIFQLGEWDDAATMVVNDSVSFFFKKYRGHMYFALDSRKLLSPSMDLFLCSDSLHILQLHVSAQLGERNLLVGPEDPEDTLWVWGRTSGWYANEFRWIYRLQDSLINIEGLTWEDAIQLTSFPHEGIEFDVLQSKVGSPPWLFRVEVRTARMGDQSLVFPAGTARDSLDGWATFVMD